MEKTREIIREKRKMYCKIRFEGYKFFLEDMVVVRNGSTDARGSNDGKTVFEREIRMS